MNQFKNFGIKPNLQGLIGEKISISKILNKEIKVVDFRIVESKFDKGNGKCLHIQIETGNEMRLIFTGSTVLQDMIQRVQKDMFPFTTTIVEESERYEFS